MQSRMMFNSMKVNCTSNLTRFPAGLIALVISLRIFQKFRTIVLTPLTSVYYRSIARV